MHHNVQGPLHPVPIPDCKISVSVPCLLPTIPSQYSYHVRKVLSHLNKVHHWDEKIPWLHLWASVVFQDLIIPIAASHRAHRPEPYQGPRRRPAYWLPVLKQVIFAMLLSSKAHPGGERNNRCTVRVIVPVYPVPAYGTKKFFPYRNGNEIPVHCCSLPQTTEHCLPGCINPVVFYDDDRLFRV